jgi:hypothetical protein
VIRPRRASSLEGKAQVLRHKGEFNFSVINNRAIARAQGRFTHYLLCNNDIEAFEAGWLERMVELGQHPSVGVVGAQLLYPDRRSIQHAGVLVGAFGAAEHYAKRVRFGEDASRSCCPEPRGSGGHALVCHPRDAPDAVHGFDGRSRLIRDGSRLQSFKQDIASFSVRMRLVHHESYTRGTTLYDPHPEGLALFRIMAPSSIGDPYYHPSLSVTSSNWDIANPLPYKAKLRRRIVDLDHHTGRQAISISA